MSETTVVDLSVQSTGYSRYPQTRRRSRESNWTDQAFDFLKSLLAEAKSATTVALELSALTGLKFSRNSIISKARREKLVLSGPRTFRPSREVAKPQKRRKPPPFPAAIRQIMPTLPFLELTAPHEPLMLSILEMETGQCYWPVTPTGAPVLFCGHPVDIKHNSWCPHHKAIGCEKPVPRTRTRPAYR
jgi:hypothetical protein